MTVKELSKNALDELQSICKTMKISANNSENDGWKFYNLGKCDGVNMTLNMMTDTDTCIDCDSRNPDNIFTCDCEPHVGQITLTIKVNADNVTAVCGTLIDNNYRVVIHDITGDTWEIEFWKE